MDGGCTSPWSRWVGIGPGKKLGPNGSYKQLLKWGTMGETRRQGQGVNKTHPCTGVRGAPHAASLNELCSSLALTPATEDMIWERRSQGRRVPQYSGSTGEIVLTATSTGAILVLKKGAKKAEHTCIGWSLGFPPPPGLFPNLSFFPNLSCFFFRKQTPGVVENNCDTADCS